MKTKMCSECKNIKPVSKFGIESRNADGYSYICKVCKREKDRTHYIMNRRKIIDRARKYREKIKSKDVDYAKESKKIKRCTGCGKVKTKSEFSRNKYSIDGYKTRCKECIKLYNRSRLA